MTTADAPTFEREVPLTDNTQLNNLLQLLAVEFGITFDESDISRWADELAGGQERTFEELRADIFKHRVGDDVLRQAVLDLAPGANDEFINQAIDQIITGSDGGFAGLVESLESGAVDISPAPGPEGAGSDSVGVLGGGELVLVSRDGADDIWVQQYEYPVGSGSFHYFTYASIEQVEQVFGENFLTTTDFTRVGEDFLDTANQVDTADAIIGQPGSFQTLIGDVQREVLAEAGITDPTIQGAILSDPEIQDIMAIAAVSNWSPAQIEAQIRQTDYWTQTLYPGIESFYAQNIAEPEAAWRQYSSNVESSLALLGYTPDADGSFTSIIGDMLNRGIDDEAFVFMAPTFARAEQSQEFANVLNQWSVNQLGQPISFDDWFDVLDGTATGDLANLVEAATLQFAANQTSLDVSEDQVTRLLGDTQFTEAQALNVFTDAERSLLGLGDEGLRLSGLSTEMLINAAAGLGSESLSAEQVQQLATEVAVELGLADDGQEARLFQGFDSNLGNPNRPGLNTLAPIGG